MGNQQTKKNKPRYYPAIPNSTIERLMGAERWKAMIEEVRREHHTRKVLIDYTAIGPMIRLTDPFGKLLGTVASVEYWATKQRRKRNKK